MVKTRGAHENRMSALQGGEKRWDLRVNTPLTGMDCGISPIATGPGFRCNRVRVQPSLSKRPVLLLEDIL